MSGDHDKYAGCRTREEMRLVDEINELNKQLDERDKRIAELEQGFMRSQDELGNRVYIYSEAQYQRQKNLETLTQEAHKRGEYGH